ncbi:MAG: hypothetical protein J0L98_06205 [Zoogloea sp.]|nr:hypothetical protein [Zoogloea sp.]
MSMQEELLPARSGACASSCPSTPCRPAPASQRSPWSTVTSSPSAFIAAFRGLFGVTSGALIAEAIARALEPQRGLVARTARKAGLDKVKLAGLEVDTSRIGKIDGLTLTDALRLLHESAEKPVALIIDEAQMESDYLGLKPTEQAVLWRMLEQGPRFRAYDAEALRFYRAKTGHPVTAAQAQRALRQRMPALVWKSARGEYAVEGAAMHRWCEKRSQAGQWPPVPPQGLLPLEDD